MTAEIHNYLHIPQSHHGTMGIRTGEIVYLGLQNTYQKHLLDGVDKDSYDCKYDLTSRRIIVLNSSGLSLDALKVILGSLTYPPGGYLPKVCENRESDGNSSIELTLDRPGQRIDLFRRDPPHTT